MTSIKEVAGTRAPFFWLIVQSLICDNTSQAHSRALLGGSGDNKENMLCKLSLKSHVSVRHHD